MVSIVAIGFFFFTCWLFSALFCSFACLFFGGQGLAKYPRPALNLLYSPGWPQTCNSPVYTSHILELQACMTMPGLLKFLTGYKFLARTQKATQHMSVTKPWTLLVKVFPPYLFFSNDSEYKLN